MYSEDEAADQLSLYFILRALRYSKSMNSTIALINDKPTKLMIFALASTLQHCTRGIVHTPAQVLTCHCEHVIMLILALTVGESTAVFMESLAIK